MFLSGDVSPEPASSGNRVWVWVGVVVVLGVIVYSFRTTAPVLNTGESFVSQGNPQTVRVDGGEVVVGPNTQVVRSDSYSVELRSGWIDASMQRGHSLRISTPRLELSNNGSKFRVETGPVTDSVVYGKSKISVDDQGVSWLVGEDGTEPQLKLRVRNKPQPEPATIIQHVPTPPVPLDAVSKYRACHFPWAGDDAEMVAMLIKDHANVNAMDDDGRTALHFASNSGNYESAKLLLEHGAKVNVKEHTQGECFYGWGWYPLHLALRSHNYELVRLLIKHGADVNAVRTDSWTPLHTAACGSPIDIVKLLISKGANCKVGNSEPLRIAASRDRIETAKLFIKLGANVNGRKIGTPEHEGKTPLFEAAFAGYEDMVKFLISKGANVNARTTAKISILQAADQGEKTFSETPEPEDANRHYDNVRKILRSHGAKG